MTMPGRKEIRKQVIKHLQERHVSPDRLATNSWFSANERLTKIELILLRSYLIFHLVHDLGSLVISQLHDLATKANLW